MKFERVIVRPRRERPRDVHSPFARYAQPARDHDAGEIYREVWAREAGAGRAQPQARHSLIEDEESAAA